MQSLSSYKPNDSLMSMTPSLNTYQDKKITSVMLNIIFIAMLIATAFVKNCYALTAINLKLENLSFLRIFSKNSDHGVDFSNKIFHLVIILFSILFSFNILYEFKLTKNTKKLYEFVVICSIVVSVLIFFVFIVFYTSGFKDPQISLEDVKREKKAKYFKVAFRAISLGFITASLFVVNTAKEMPKIQKYIFLSLHCFFLLISIIAQIAQQGIDANYRI